MKKSLLKFSFALLFLVGLINCITGQSSLYDHLFTSGQPLTLKVETKINKLITAGATEKYQDATIDIQQGEFQLSTDVQIRTRGKMRKTVCDLPPTKVKLSKKLLEEKGFAKKNKLKLVFPCRNTDQDEQKLIREHLIYDLYHLIDDNGLRSKVIDIEITTKGKTRYEFKSLLLEDEDAYALRKNARIIEKGRLYQDGLERDSWLKMLWFSYMIGNTDWSLPHKHNVELVKLPKYTRSLSLPYDFDYSGFVYQDYAVPNPSLPIKSVRQRYFFQYEMTDDECNRMIELFKSNQKAILDIIQSNEDLNDINKKNCTDYLMDFFTELEDPEKLKKKIRLAGS